MSNVFADFLQKSGLYDKIEITPDNINDLVDLINGDVRIDSYCPFCGEKRVFTMKPICAVDADESSVYNLASRLSTLQELGFTRTIQYEDGTSDEVWAWYNWQCENSVRLMNFHYVCTMDETHHLDYVVRTCDNEMWIIGQYPSVADLSFPELDIYKKVLNSEDRRELRRAIGLYAQGIGIGSYAYLRRVFERIINQAKDTATAENALDLDAYAKSRVVEKIVLLKDYLPAFMVANKDVYGVISKGIHELSEEECLSYFPIMKDTIFMILQQWEQKRKEAETARTLTASVAKIVSKIK